MATKQNDAYPEGYMAAATPAQAARILNVDGRTYRNVLRAKLGVYVSRGGVFDDAAKVAAFDIISARKASQTPVAE
jgi:hypothetical protein